MSRTSNAQGSPLKPLKWYRKLATERGRRAAGVFLVEGDKSIRQIIEGHPDEILEIVTIKERLSGYAGYPLRHLGESQFRSICNTVTPQGIVAVVRLPSDIYSADLPKAVGGRVLLLEDIQDPGNVGTLIRTAAAFRYSGVIMTGRCADPLSPKCVQATAGSVLAVWIRRTARYLGLVAALKADGYSLIAADLDGSADASVLSGRDRLVLALGSEASGLSEQTLQAADHRFRIPIAQGSVESLNVAASGAICM
jgi:TrmH family RNA methyltransferase